MAYQLLITPEAELDLQQAQEWYNWQLSGLGNDFLRCVEDALHRIAKSPELHAVVWRDVRQTMVKRFPYSITYVIEDDSVYITAIFHGHRNPRIWQQRS